MKEIIEKLKERRKSLKLSLEEVSRKTKIHIEILKKIEEGRFEDITPVYLKGFIKIYANFLKINVDEMLKEIEEKVPSLRERPLPLKSGILKKATKIKRIKTSTLIKFFTFLLLFCLISFSLFTLSKKIKSQLLSKKGPLKQTPSVKATFSPKRQKFLEVAIRAKRDTYLQVKVDGETVFQNFLIRGFTETWRAKKEVRLWIGDAGGIDIEVNGRLLPKLGKDRQILREVIITPEKIEVKR